MHSDVINLHVRTSPEGEKKKKKGETDRTREIATNTYTFRRTQGCVHTHPLRA